MSIEQTPSVTLAGQLSAESVAAHLAGIVAAIPPIYLQRQRWFGSKTKAVADLALRDATIVTLHSPIGLLLLLDVRFVDGTNEIYSLPVAIRPTAAFARLPSVDPARALLRIESDSGGAVLYDALADEAFCGTLLDRVASASTLPGRQGAFAFRRTDRFAFDPGGSPAATGRRARSIGAEQSNTSVVFDDRLMLKVFRKLEDGVNPEVEIGDFLTRRTSFRSVPLLAGAIEYRGAGESRFDLGMLQQFVANAGDGWTYTLAHLRAFFAAVCRGAFSSGVTTCRAPDYESVHAMLQHEAPYLEDARQLGRITGALHRALASDPDDPSFAPEPMTLADLEHLASSVTAHLQDALALLERGIGRRAPAVQRTARRVLRLESGYRAALAEPSKLLPGAGDSASALGYKTRCHGDYHLGQVLKTADGFVVLDFEGEPARPLAERRAKMSPLRDIAGMLRSFDYAATAGVREAATATGLEPAALLSWARAWEQVVTGAFLRGYRSAIAGVACLSASPTESNRLLQVYELEKALYELVYELNNRPDWVAIPLDRLARWAG